MNMEYYNYNMVLIYRKARKYVIDKSAIDTFPKECLYSLDQLLDEDWFPSIKNN